MSKSVKRLFEQFQPSEYGLAFTIDPESLSFSGTVMIRGKKVGRPSERLTFHQKELKITAATITKHDKKGDQFHEVSRINTQASFDEVRLHAAEQLYPGEYTITMDFEGLVSRPMNGIYPCFFKHDGVEKRLIATQFESHHAREAFPCIDEPEAKASFDLTLITPDVKTVIANTPIKSQETAGDKLVTSFETTPKMSTYLLAFVFGELGSIEATTKDGVLVRAFATPDNVAHTEFALDCAVKTLEFYNQYFDIAYPLPKCDFIALPDFASGAMENWGCITFREQALLVDAKNTSLHLKQYVANVVAHELTHQWFGNLVTMRWWTDLWLNESFASWMSYLAVDHLFPEWKVWTQFIVDEQLVALKQDSLENTHPIQVTVHHPDEIRTIFDAISYEKGASVLLQLHEYLGADLFRDGLRLYLKKHAYSNTDTIDLWAALEEVSQQPVTEFMTAWIGLPGYPIVTAKVTDNVVSLTQERFYLNPSADKQKSVWPIPLAPSIPLSETTLITSEATLTSQQTTGQLVLNHDRTSFYRVAYDTPHLDKIAASLSELNDLDRVGLLTDTFEAAKAGYAPTVDALKLLEAYREEASIVVWDIIAGNLGSIRLVMEDDSLRDSIKPFVRELVNKQYQRLGWGEQPSDDHFDTLLRPTILGLASFGEEPSVVSESQTRFAAATTSEDIHPDLRGVVYGTVARLGGEAEFEKLVALHNSSTNSEDRVTIAAALTNFKNPVLIARSLQMITGSEVRLQDAPYWIAYSFMNRHARTDTWEWLQSHWQWLVENLGTDLSFFRMPVYAGRVYSDLDFLPEFKAFFESKLSPAFERPIKQAIETIEWQAAWKARDLDSLKNYFAHKQ
jgi:puromycin-sensitive aminopeptidase